MTSRFQIVLCDFVTGRLEGGHQEDYLVALEEALSGRGCEVIAPFRRSQSKPRPPTGRLGRYFLTYRLIAERMRASQPSLLVFHSPDLRDILSYAAAAALMGPKPSLGVFVMRRDAVGMAGPGVSARILEWTVRTLARAGRIFMVFDSVAARRHWAPGNDAAPVVTIPLRRSNTMPSRDVAGRSPCIGLLGAFRLEKGARHYDRIIGLSRQAFPELTIRCQLPSDCSNSAEGALAEALRSRWAGDENVVFHTGHLSNDAFANLIHAVDVLVLPYDAESYGVGTSGVMFESHAAGNVVVSTRIQWGLEHFGDDPAMVWLDDLTDQGLMAGIEEGVRRARSRPPLANTPGSDPFGQSWLEALDAAARAALRRADAGAR